MHTGLQVPPVDGQYSEATCIQTCDPRGPTFVLVLFPKVGRLGSHRPPLSVDNTVEGMSSKLMAKREGALLPATFTPAPLN